MLFAKDLSELFRDLEMSHMIIVNMIVFVNVSNFFEVDGFFYGMTFGLGHSCVDLSGGVTSIFTTF